MFAEYDGDNVPAVGPAEAGVVLAERAGGVLVRAGAGGGDGAVHRGPRRAARHAAHRPRAARETQRILFVQHNSSKNTHTHATLTPVN